ncbi:MAG: hypothetical protein LAN64_20605 [Acidobacteriia bacterium]|nr:hypothetical protein [Terriglobia bacterium]
MNDTWLGIATVMRVTGDAERTVRRKAASGAYASRYQRRKRRGRPQLEIAISSLSADAQTKYARLQLEAAQCHTLVPADPAQPSHSPLRWKSMCAPGAPSRKSSAPRPSGACK